MEILPLRLMPTRALPDPRAGTRLILAKNSMRGHGDGMPAGRPARWLLEESRPAPSSARPSELQEALLTSYKFLAGLPVKPQSELDEPRSTVAADCAHGGRSRRTAYKLNVARRQVELSMVEEVEEVSAELYPAALSNGEALHCGEVHVCLPGTFEQIARHVACLAAERLREHRAATRRKGMAGERVARVSVVRGQACDAGSPVRPVRELVEPAVVVGRSREDRVGEARTVGDDAGDAPPADKLAHHAVRTASQGTVRPEGQIVDEGSGEAMPHIESGPAVVQPAILRVGVLAKIPVGPEEARIVIQGFPELVGGGEAEPVARPLPQRRDHSVVVRVALEGPVKDAGELPEGEDAQVWGLIAAHQWVWAHDGHVGLIRVKVNAELPPLRTDVGDFRGEVVSYLAFHFQGVIHRVGCGRVKLPRVERDDPALTLRLHGWVGTEESPVLVEHCPPGVSGSRKSGG